MGALLGAQPFVRLLDATLGGGERALTLSSELREAKTLDVTQHPREPERHRQAREPRVELRQLGEHVGRSPAVGDLGQTSIVHASVEPQAREQTPASKATMGLVHGDAHQPVTKAPRIAELGEIAKRRDERILHHVLRLHGTRE